VGQNWRSVGATGTAGKAMDCCRPGLLKNAAPAAPFRGALALLFVGFRRQTSNNYSQGEHQGPRNQIISVKVGATLGYMLYQKRQGAKGY
jgi:hypothetical protein